MPVTVAAIEAELVSRLGGLLLGVGLSVLTNGANPVLAGAIRKALCLTGKPPADPVAVTDLDVLSLSGMAFERLLDYAEYAVLDKILGNFAGVDEQVGTNYQKLSQLAAQIEGQLAAVLKRINSPMGVGATRIAVGSIKTGQPLPNDPLNPRSFEVGWPYPQ